MLPLLVGDEDKVNRLRLTLKVSRGLGRPGGLDVKGREDGRGDGGKK